MNALGGGIEAGKIQALGASVVSLNVNDVYQALEKGVVDGSSTNWELMTSRKFSDYLKYTTVGIELSGEQRFYMIINLKKWNSLPPDIQKVFQ